MSADQKDDQRVFQQKQRDLLMATKDLSKHSIHPDVVDLEESLERGTSVRCCMMFMRVKTSPLQYV
jgi:hypothetical protein